MTPAQFTSALAGTRMDPASKASAAARLVLVNGMSRKQAAEEVGIHHSAVSVAVARIQPRHVCPHCEGSGYVLSKKRITATSSVSTGETKLDLG